MPVRSAAFLGLKSQCQRRFAIPRATPPTPVIPAKRWGRPSNPQEEGWTLFRGEDAGFVISLAGNSASIPSCLVKADLPRPFLAVRRSFRLRWECRHCSHDLSLLISLREIPKGACWHVLQRVAESYSHLAHSCFFPDESRLILGAITACEICSLASLISKKREVAVRERQATELNVAQTIVFQVCWWIR